MIKNTFVKNLGVLIVLINQSFKYLYLFLKRNIICEENLNTPLPPIEVDENILNYVFHKNVVPYYCIKF